MSDSVALVALEVNGKPHEVKPACSLAGLVARLPLAGKAFAVERNGEVVRRADYESTILDAGDRIEIVGFVGGG